MIHSKTKRIVALGALGLALWTSPLTMASETPNWSLVGGANISALVGNTQGGSDIGVHVGGKYDISLTDHSGVDISFLYSIKNSTLSSGSQTLKLHTTHCEIPIVYRYNFPSGIEITGGGYASYLLSSTISLNSLSVDISSDFNNLDYGAMAGIAYKTGNWNLGISYQLGLADVTKDGLIDKYSNIMLTAAYTLN